MRAASRAVVSNVTPAVATAGTPVVFSGYTYDPIDNHAVPNKSVALGVTVNETERYYSTTSDTNGVFSYTFQPLPNEAGDYTVGADYPYVSQISTQASFTLLGMQAVPAGLRLQVLPNTPLTGRLVLSNLTGHALSGLNVVVPDLKGALTAQFAFTNNTLPASGAVTVDYSLLSALTRSAQVKFSATATSAEGAQLTVPFQVSVVPLVAQLNADPGYLARGMLRGRQTVVSFDLINSGGASSGDLTVRLPALSWMTLGSTATIPSIPAGGKATVTLILNPPSDMTLGLYPGTIAVANENTGVSVAYQFRAVSDAAGDLQVTATDDYTYYVAGGPKVTNAAVTLRDPFTSAIVARTNTDANGIAYFTAVPEGPYTLEAFADKHNAYRGSVSVRAGAVTDQEAFLPRQLVTYQWTVVPTEIQDKYKIVLESVFETDVPVPNVIIVEPKILLLVAPGEVSQFDMKLRNEGLIAAENVTVGVPDDPDFLVTPLVETVGTIPAKSTVTVPVTVQLRSTAIAKAAARKAGGRVVLPKDDGCSTSSLHACLPDIPLKVKYTVRCGTNNKSEERTADLSVICTSKSVMDCLKDLKTLTGTANMVSWACDTLAAFLSCAGPDLDPCAKMGIAAACGAVVGGVTGGWAGAGSGAASAGGAAMPECICSRLKNLKLPAMPSSGGTGSADVSYGAGLATGYFASGFPTVTGYIINNGNCADTPAPKSAATSTTTAPQSMGLAAAPQFASLAAALRPKGSGGVCARVRIRIEQSVVLTRTAFRGSLEIDNGGTTNISGIRVSLDFRDGTNGPASDKFYMEGPVVTGMGGVNGDGVLAGGATGSAVYTFIPTVDAAPMAPASYQIGGTLSYYDGGELVTVPLLSSQITVYPEARLDLAYFQQRDVYGDDPFTTEVEPSEPFTLGLIVKNIGAGSARNFQITSGQPRIVENEKGLLIDFTIIGTRVGDQAISPTLTASLGDIAPGAAREVTWSMLSSLQGKFISFNASFEHEDELGSTNTSLINSVEIHELTHPVLANRTNDDAVLDFLVNDIPDPGNLPDTLYLSDGTVASVNVVTNGAFDAPAGAGHLHVLLTANVGGGWNYLQLPDPGADYILAGVFRSDGKVLALTNNAWTTDRSFPAASSGAVRENLLHLFDWAGTGGYTLYYRSTNTTPPAIIQVGPVTPFTRTGAVYSVEVVFSEPIDPGTFDYTALTLTRNGGANLITGGAGLGFTMVSNTTYAVTGLEPYTAADGNYQFAVSGANIVDLWGNHAGNVSASTQWAKGDVPPIVESIAAISPSPRNIPVSSVTVTFSKAINAATFDYHNITLTLNGGADLITSAVTITPQSSTTFAIRGLGALTGAEGTYTLTINAMNIQDTGGRPGLGAQSVTWDMFTTGPRIAGLQPVSTNPRNIVVQSLALQFFRAIDPATFDWHDFTLTRNGGTNLITSEATVTRANDTNYVIGNISWVQGYAGTYSFTVNAAGIADLAGNAGAGSTNELWTMILSTPPTPTNLMIAPDLGISSKDGLTSTNAVTLSGTVGTNGLSVRIYDQTLSADLGEAAVDGTNFSASLAFTFQGQHHLRVTAADVAGNVSLPASFDLFLDLIPPVASLTAVSPNPRLTPVGSVDVSFSKPINPGTLDYQDFQLVRDGGSNLITAAITVRSMAGNSYRVANLSNLTATVGTYVMTLHGASVQDLAGNAVQSDVSAAWEVQSNHPPVLAPIANRTINEGFPLTITNAATDPDVPPQTLTFTLGAGAPAGAVIAPASGLFFWRPSAVQGPSTNLITIVVSDNGAPSLSATQQFTVVVRDILPDLLLSLGSTNMMSGATNSVPLVVHTALDLTNLAVTLGPLTDRVTNLALVALAPEVISAALQPLGAGTYSANFALNPVLGTNAIRVLARLAFLALTNPHSAVVPLTLSAPSARRFDGKTVAQSSASGGRVIIVAAEPVLDINGAGAMTLYAKPNFCYALEYSTNIGPDSAWTRLRPIAVTQQATPVSGLGGPFSRIFYRAVEFNPDPPYVEADRNADGSRYLTLFGKPGSAYVIQSSTAMGRPTTWSSVTNFPLSTPFAKIPVANMGTVFFRAGEIFASPPLMNVVRNADGSADITLFGRAGYAYLLQSAPLANPDLWRILQRIALDQSFIALHLTNLTSSLLSASEYAPDPSVLELSARGDGTAGLRLFGKPGSSYSIENTGTLGAAANWNSLFRVPLATSYANLTTIPMSQKSAFYRSVEFTADVPILEALVNPDRSRKLLLYGRKAQSYAVEYTTNFSSHPSWYPLATNTLTSSFGYVNVTNTANSIFYRLLQQ